MITEMLNQMRTELTATLDALNVMPLLVLMLGAVIFYTGYNYIVNKS